MDELVLRIVTATGIDPAVAGKAVIVLLRFLIREGPPDKVDKLIERLPGAREAIAADRSKHDGKGIVGVCSDLTSAGLSMFKVHSVASAMAAFAREKVGAADVDHVIRAITGAGSPPRRRDILKSRRGETSSDANSGLRLY